MAAPARSIERAVVSPGRWLHPPVTLPHIAPEPPLSHYVRDSPERQPVAPGPSSQNLFYLHNRRPGFRAAAARWVTIAPLFATSLPPARPDRPVNRVLPGANTPGKRLRACSRSRIARQFY